MVKFIDLFAGMGGIRCGLELAAKELGVETQCVFTSEIKPYAVKVLLQNHPNETIHGDITHIESNKIPDFDILLGGFPCQAFSYAGKRKGFADTRGTLFFEIERILKDKKPKGFILENVEGLESHDKGNTLKTIIKHLRDLGYDVNYKVLNSKEFGVPQERKRIYIVGTKDHKAPPLSGFSRHNATLGDILETGKPVCNTPFIRLLLSKFTISQLYGKAIKDKRGGDTNIHSWDLELKGSISKEQKRLLNILLKERRKKKWAELIGIEWMDGMPLTEEQISTFFVTNNLHEMLIDLTNKGYLKYEYPKKKVTVTNDDGITSSFRTYDTTRPKGYNIVTGKLSFEINKVLSPNEIAPTLVAMDMKKLYVGDNGGLRRFTFREGLRLFGYPETYKMVVTEKEAFDLLGNTVVVPVIKAVANQLLECLYKKHNHDKTNSRGSIRQTPKQRPNIDHYRTNKVLFR